jgi:hypothetical protein
VMKWRWPVPVGQAPGARPSRLASDDQRHDSAESSPAVHTARRDRLAPPETHLEAASPSRGSIRCWANPDFMSRINQWQGVLYVYTV